jgi:glycosyltransferase involved in cell wall biosynthesis
MMRAPMGLLPPIGWLRHNFLPPSETFIYTALRALQAAEVDVRVLAIHRRCADKFPTDAVTALADGPLGWLETALYWSTGRSPRQGRWARGVRLIHAHMGYTGVHALDAARRHGLPLVVSFYGHDVALGGSRERLLPPYWPYAACRRHLLREATRVHVLSRHMHAALVAQGCPADKLRVVRLGVPLARFELPREPTAGPLRVLMVGREVEKKGFDDGLRACAGARAAGVDLRVALLGTGGPLQPALRRLAGELGLAVDWLDPRADVARAMAAADVLLVPSRTAADGDQEGTPTVICEGSAAALPIVSTLHAGIPEQVEPGRTGLLVGERDVAGLAAALAELARAPDLRAAMGAAGRAKMRAEYSLEAHRDALLHSYRELLS